MLDSFINDVIGVFRNTFLGGDLLGIGIAFGAVLIAAMMMRRTGQIGSMTMVALILFAIGGIARCVTLAAPGGVALGGRIISQFQASWAELMALPTGGLLAYFGAFMAAVLIFYALKSLLSRG